MHLHLFVSVVFLVTYMLSGDIYGDELRVEVTELELASKAFPSKDIWATGVNNRGDIIGVAIGPPEEEGFYYFEDELHRLGKGTPVAVNAIGDVLLVVSEMDVNDSKKSFFLPHRTKERFEIPILPGNTSCSAADLNDSGQVVGICSKDEVNVAADTTPFLWHPKKVKKGSGT